MGIQNFPAALQPIIQTGILEREFEQALRSKLGYRAVADRESFPNRIGETVTKTRAGLKPTAKTPLAPASNTNFDNGLSPSGWGVEQYTLSINAYGDTIDLNMVTDRVGIASQFVQNAKVNAEQAARTLDELARDALFNAYFGGNTRVRTTLGAAGPAVAVDDVRGFLNVFVNGRQVPVSGGNPMTVTVGSNTYSLVSVAVDGTSVSTTPNGVSGTLTFSGNVTVADGTAGNAVQAATASQIIRPNGRATAAGLIAGDALTMSNILDAVALMRLNAVPGVGGGEMYNCYLDPRSARQLFADSDFRQLFQGVGLQAEFQMGRLESPFLGVRMLPTTEAYVQAHPTVAGAFIRRPIIVGQGALVEGDFAGLGASDVAQGVTVTSMHDGVAMITREPLDRLGQIIAQSWEWIGGFCPPSDTTTSPTTISTATNAAFKRAVMIEHMG